MMAIRKVTCPADKDEESTFTLEKNCQALNSKGENIPLVTRSEVHYLTLGFRAGIRKINRTGFSLQKGKAKYKREWEKRKVVNKDIPWRRFVM